MAFPTTGFGGGSASGLVPHPGNYTPRGRAINGMLNRSYQRRDAGLGLMEQRLGARNRMSMNTLNTYNSMGQESLFQNGLRQRADNAIAGNPYSSGLSRDPEVTPSQLALVNGPGRGLGDAFGSNYQQARKPFELPGTFSRTANRPLMSMGGPIDEHYGLPKYTEGNSFQSSSGNGTAVRVEYDPIRGSMRLIGEKPTGARAERLATQQAAINARINARQQRDSDMKVLRAARMYGLPPDVPAVAAARERLGSSVASKSSKNRDLQVAIRNGKMQLVGKLMEELTQQHLRKARGENGGMMGEHPDQAISRINQQLAGLLSGIDDAFGLPSAPPPEPISAIPQASVRPRSTYTTPRGFFP